MSLHQPIERSQVYDVALKAMQAAKALENAERGDLVAEALLETARDKINAFLESGNGA